MAKTLSEIVSELRAEGASITHFRKKYIRDVETTNRLFEFSVYFDRIDKLSKVVGRNAVVVMGKNRRFAWSPGNRNDFNYVELGEFLFYFGVEFAGLSAPATHAPDVSIVHKKCPGRVLIAVECKHHPGKSLGKQEVMAFAATIADLIRPAIINSSNREIIYDGKACYHCIVVEIIDAPLDADSITQAYGDGRSCLATTAHSVAPNSNLVADSFRFKIEQRRFP